MSIGTLLLIILILLLVGALPQTGIHSWGYAPGGIIGILLIVVLVLVLTGRL